VSKGKIKDVCIDTKVQYTSGVQCLVRRTISKMELNQMHNHRRVVCNETKHIPI